MGQEESTLIDPSARPHTLRERSLDAVAEYIKSGKVKRIVVMTGAGISTAAGIPDFRTPGTGLYSNLARLNLPHAEAVFDIDYFRENPDPFYILANELYPGKFHPTISHAFIALLAKRNLLQMLFTQNIDCLERRAGVPADKIIEAHGSFASQRCIECKEPYPEEEMKEHVFANKVPRCLDETCKGLVKPDIVFFGEPLPKAFEQNAPLAMMADLILVVGTSLTVYPFAGLPEMAKPGRPRVLFNMERVGKLGVRADDVLELGSCDDGIRRLAEKLGWEKDLERLWRGVVGDEEADRQSGRKKEEVRHEVEDEVERLAEGVEKTLNLEEHTENEAANKETADQRDEKEEAEAQVAAGHAGMEREDTKSPVVKNEAALGSTEDLPSQVGKVDAKKSPQHTAEAEVEALPANASAEPVGISDGTPGNVMSYGPPSGDDLIAEEEKREDKSDT